MSQSQTYQGRQPNQRSKQDARDNSANVHSSGGRLSTGQLLVVHATNLILMEARQTKESHC